VTRTQTSPDRPLAATYRSSTSHAALPRHQRTRSGFRYRRVAHVLGEILITFGLVVLLFAVYEVYGKTAIVDAHQSRLDRQLDQLWAQPTAGPPGAAKPGRNPATVPPGGALGRLYIPKLKMRWVVVEGVTLHDLAFGPGHYPGTALPGQIGNFAVAGHRIPAVFWNLQEIHPGDQLVVETRDDWYVYQVTVSELVTPHSVEVVAPDPDHEGVTPTKAMMTLTTCNPKWDNYQRMAIHAQLVNKRPRADGPPVALGS
jgi:sortase A